MAKAPRKKSAKKSVKKSKKAAEETPQVQYDDDDDDENVTSDDEEQREEEEEEEEEEDERRRQKLLEAISNMGGKRKKTLGERSEAAVQMSEFTVNAEGEGDKIQLSDLIGSLEKTPTVPVQTRKQLKNLQRIRTIDSPLTRQESDRIQRDVAFQKAAAEVSKWTGVIWQNQKAEQLVFPLDQEPPGPRPMERVVTGWKARTPLEEEVFALLSANKQPIHDPVLTPKEEASVRAMSLEDAKIRRAELQKARALQSYYEARARRERKIKSKAYHKVHNKAKRKEFVKRFDEMVRTDPAAALEELDRMEVARMQERMSLKHQNSGKWAKTKAIMAKYDEGARKAMQQQLEVNKELTLKVKTSLNQEEEEEEEAQEEEVMMPDFVNDAEREVDASNPWMRGRLTEEAGEEEEEVEEQREEERKTAEEEEEVEEVEEAEEEVLLREFERRRKQRQEKEEVMTVEEKEEEKEKEEEVMTVEEEGGEEVKASDKEEEKEKEVEEEALSEFTSIFRGLTKAEKPDLDLADPSPRLEEGLTRIRTLEDVDLLPQEEEESAAAAGEAPAHPPSAEDAPPSDRKKRKRKRGVELRQVLTKETKVVQVPLAPTVEDGEDGEDGDLEQRGLIREAFAGDDVVSDFLRDKRQQEEAGKPKVVDLTLPGWGEWGGTGLKPSRRKRKRFRVKTAPAPARKDQQLPSVIMSEKRSSSVALHQVSSLPFPFENHQQFESTVRTPLGRTWNTERTVRKVTKPRVVTQLGAIIQPMTREELLKGGRRREEAKVEPSHGGGHRTRTRN